MKELTEQQGPIMKYTCDGCKYKEHEFYNVQGDSGCNHYCTFKGERKYIYDTSGMQECPTPGWCPLLSKDQPVKPTVQDIFPIAGPRPKTTLTTEEMKNLIEEAKNEDSSPEITSAFEPVVGAEEWLDKNLPKGASLRNHVEAISGYMEDFASYVASKMARENEELKGRVRKLESALRWMLWNAHIPSGLGEERVKEIEELITPKDINGNPLNSKTN